MDQKIFSKRISAVKGARSAPARDNLPLGLMKRAYLGDLTGPGLILGIFVASSMLTRPLLPVDETRYLGVAWEMWLSGDHVILSRNGIPYTHKPPLLFWLINVGWSWFGVNDWWPRLLSPLFSLGSLLLTGSIARALWPNDERGARLSLLILSSSLAWMVFSSALMFDVMLAFFVLAGLRGLLQARDGWLQVGMLWFGLALGLGLLAKGPVAFLHLLAPALALPFWQRDLSKKSWYCALVCTIAGGLGLVSIWLVPAVIRGGEAFRDALLWGQTADRLVDSVAHRHPFWWYLPFLPVVVFPWLTWPPLWSALAALRRSALDSGQRFCLWWILPSFGAFSLISGKQLHYLVPLIPGIALFSGNLLARQDYNDGMLLPTFILGLVGIVMLYCALAGSPYRPDAWIPLPIWPGATLLVLIIALTEFVRRYGFAPQCLAIMSGSALLLSLFFISANLRAFYDLSPMANAIRAWQEQNRPVAHIGHYHDQFQFAGRLTRPLSELKQSDVPAWLNEHPDGAILAYFDRTGPKAAETPREFLFSQAQRLKTVVLLSAPQARALVQR